MYTHNTYMYIYMIIYIYIYIYVCVYYIYIYIVFSYVSFVKLSYPISTTLLTATKEGRGGSRLWKPAPNSRLSFLLALC